MLKMGGLHATRSIEGFVCFLTVFSSYIYLGVDEGVTSEPLIVREEVEINGQNQEELFKLPKKFGLDYIAKAIAKKINLMVF